MIRHVVAFDLEGTLVDVEHVHHEGHLRAAAEVGLHLTADEAIGRLPHFIGGPDAEIAREIWEASGGRRSTVGTILASTKRFYAENIGRAEVALRPGAADFLGTLRGEGVPIAIGSCTPRSQAAHLLDASGLLRFVSPGCVVLAEDVKRLKPSPDVFCQTAEKMCVRAANQIVFDDSVNGVWAARAAGSVAVGVPLRTQTVDALFQAGAARVVLDWRAVSGRAVDFLAEVMAIHQGRSRGPLHAR